MRFSLLCIIASLDSTIHSECSYSIFANQETEDIYQQLRMNTLQETINCCFKDRGQRKRMRNRGALTEPRDVLFVHLQIHYRNALEQYLVEHTVISSVTGCASMITYYSI